MPKGFGGPSGARDGNTRNDPPKVPSSGASVRERKASGSGRNSPMELDPKINKSSSASGPS